MGLGPPAARLARARYVAVILLTVACWAALAGVGSMEQLLWADGTIRDLD